MKCRWQPREEGDTYLAKASMGLRKPVNHFLALRRQASSAVTSENELLSASGRGKKGASF